jgi:uncharacterized protein (DUF169 family)
MTDYAAVERQLTSLLGLRRRPVAMTPAADVPKGVRKFDGVMPSSCSFWRLAADGAVFYTEAADHYNCPIGSYTHNIPLPPSRAGELEQVLTLMSDIGYLRMQEVPRIPQLRDTPAVIVYAPLGATPIAPDAVIVSGQPKALMLLEEAALRAGVGAPAPLMGRPTCMAVPAAIANGISTSLGCIGNRVYTSVGDDEFYVVIGGGVVEAVASELDRIATANRTLEEYHRGRQTVATA